MNDYLFDKSGEADPDVERLEGLLAQYRHERPFVFRAAGEAKPWFSAWWFRGAMGAAAAVLLIALLLFFRIGTRGQVQWAAQRRAGDPQVNAKVLSGSAKLNAGSTIATDARSEVELEAAGHGRIRILPGSEVRLVESGTKHQRLDLQRGAIEARLFAPPFMFSFETPSGTAYDIGCAFRLSVDDDKRGKLEVLSGWVQFEVGDAQSLAPAGTEVSVEPGFVPGTPVYEDADPIFRKAVHDFDFGSEAGRKFALAEAMNHAREKDVYTLLRLMIKATPEERGILFDRASRLKPPPSWVTREGIVRREGPMIDAWTQSLGLGDAKRWWVNWKDRF